MKGFIMAKEQRQAAQAKVLASVFKLVPIEDNYILYKAVWKDLNTGTYYANYNLGCGGKKFYYTKGGISEVKNCGNPKHQCDRGIHLGSIRFAREFARGIGGSWRRSNVLVPVVIACQFRLEDVVFAENFHKDKIRVRRCLMLGEVV